MIMESNDKRPSTFLSRMSNDSFISLFMVGVLIVIFGLACIIVPNFLTPKNIVNILTNNWYIIILGIGVTFLLITGNFDMSVGGVIGLSGVLSVYFVQGVNVSPNELANGLGMPYIVAILAAMACATCIGAINAFFIARSRCPPSSSPSAR
jgi:ribose/xylose/arabinose/galactoside ABC-type transport system permease subunit